MRFDYRALGRLRPGEKNNTETAYEQHLNLLMHAGEILWFKFEGIKLRLADRTFYTVDFFVLKKNHVLEAHEVKGYMTDDANVKLKVAAEEFPFVFKLIRKGKKGQWEVREV